MATPRWLWDGCAVTGNLAKVQVLVDLIETAQDGRVRRILDVGCAGPSPLNLWEPLLSSPEAPPIEIHGVDVDAAGIEAVRRRAEERGYRQVAEVKQGSAYDLARLYPLGEFDVVVSTQVLEHLARPAEFVRGAAEVLKRGGVLYATLDSGHFPSHDPWWKRAARRVLVGMGRERFHERGLTEEDLEPIFRAGGFEVADRRFYNLQALKRIHNQATEEARKNRLAEAWKGLEDLLNEDKAFLANGRHWFADIYYKLRRQ